MTTRLQVELILAADGMTTITDYDNSVWDSEDKCYIFTALSILEFKNALGYVTAELHIKAEENQPPELSEIKLIAPHGVILSVDEEQIHFSDVSFEEDAKADQMDALEEYYKH